MTAKIVGFVSRAQAGLRAPKSVSRNIDASRGGVAVHHGGDGPPPKSHDGCLRVWKSWQTFHMDTRGWADIAYNFGFCDHGYVFAGRGFGVRSAAQGTNEGNSHFYAAVWLGGGNAIPTAAARSALEWIIDQARRNGHAGNQVRPHRFFHATGCPGSYLSTVSIALSGVPIQGPKAKVITPPKPKKAPPYPLPKSRFFGEADVDGTRGYKPFVVQIQNLLRSRGHKIGNDGIFGPRTEAAVVSFQRSKRLTADGKVGPLTWSKLWQN